MRSMLKPFLPTVLAVSVALTAVVPLNAAPMFAPKAPEAGSQVEPVQYRDWRRANRVDRRLDRYAARRDFYRRGDARYYRGYRGYRYHRDGYREYNGWWFPAAAFVAGALVTGAINSSRSSGNAHVEWCYDRYRSYRASDNTYQPYNGPRRQCYSPYD